MQREIKFRAWLTNEEGKSGMCYDYAVNSRQNGEIIKPSFHSKSDFYLVKECVLMQFTGLYDKNNNPIYEGDIITGNTKSDFKWPHKGYVEYLSINSCFGINVGLEPASNSDNDHYTYFQYLENIEVVGNIYESSEILKDKIYNSNL
jgi:uncharacterized phage protein (TIGR01671 family)